MRICPSPFFLLPLSHVCKARFKRRALAESNSRRDVWNHFWNSRRGRGTWLDRLGPCRAMLQSSAAQSTAWFQTSRYIAVLNRNKFLSGGAAKLRLRMRSSLREVKCRGRHSASLHSGEMGLCSRFPLQVMPDMIQNKLKCSLRYAKCSFEPLLCVRIADESTRSCFFQVVGMIEGSSLQSCLKATKWLW